MNQNAALSANQAFPHLIVERNLFFLACLLCGLPVWLPLFPPMVDLPQHASQISLLLNLGKPDFPFANEFQLNLFTPYLQGYALIAVFTPWLGIVAASKLAVWLALAGFAVASRFLLRQAGADPYWSWLTFPVLYGFTYQWGFLNFLIAAPLGIAFLGLIWRNNDPVNLKSSLLVVVMLYALFFCHALVMGLFSMLALFLWAYASTGWRDFCKRAWPMLALLPLVAAWLVFASKNPQTAAGYWDLSWINANDLYYSYASTWINPEHPGWGRVTGFFPRLLGERQSLFVTFFGALLFVLPFLAGCRLSKSIVRWVPLFSIALLLLLFPSTFFGVSYNYQRFTFMTIPLFLLIVDAPENQAKWRHGLRWLAPLIAIGWIAYMSVQALQFNNDAAGFDSVIAQMEPGKRVRSQIFMRDATYTIAPSFLHFPSWYSAMKNGVVDMSFAEFYQLPVVYKPEYIPGQLGSEWGPADFHWQADGGYKYDYFIVRSPKDFGESIFKDASCPIYQVTHSGHWWLYRRDPAC